MELTDTQLVEIHDRCRSRQPGWTLTHWQHAARRLPAGAEFADVLTRADRLADRPDARTPGLLPVIWEALATPAEPWLIEKPTVKLWPGTRIRQDDPLPGDRDPTTGRTDPARQRARLQRLMDGPA